MGCVRSRHAAAPPLATGAATVRGAAGSSELDKLADEVVLVDDDGAEEEEEEDEEDGKETDGDATEDEGGDALGAGVNARYEICLSHVKGRGSVFGDAHCDFFVVFSWAGERKATMHVAGGQTPAGAKWDGMLHFDYRASNAEEKDNKFSDSMQDLHHKTQERLDKHEQHGHQKQQKGNKRTNSWRRRPRPRLPTRPADEQLIVECHAIRRHHLRENENWLLGSVAVPLDTVMCGPLHHVFVLEPPKHGTPGYSAAAAAATKEPVRLSYNCRITQFARWRLLLSRVRVEYEEPGQPPPRTAGGLETDVIAEEEGALPAATQCEAECEAESGTAATDAKSAVSVPSSLLKMESSRVIKTMRHIDLMADHSRRFNLRYRLATNDRESGPSFLSRTAPTPHVDALGVVLSCEWPSDALPPVEEAEEGRFRSFLAATVGFTLLEKVGLDNQPLQPLSPSEHRMKATRSVSHGEEDGRTIGECWVPVEQLFEGAQRQETDDDEVRDGQCACRDRVGKRPHAATVFFAKDLYHVGQKAGRLSCTMCFDRLPGLMQLGHGVLTENGVSLVSPIVLHGAHKHTSLLQRLLLVRPDQEHSFSAAPARALAAAVRILEGALKSDPGLSKRTREEQLRAHQLKSRACQDLLKLLETSQKESMPAFVYDSQAELLRMQVMLVGLWELLLEWLDAVPFTIRIYFFDVLSSLLRRGELGEFMLVDMLRAKQQTKQAVRTAAAGLGFTTHSHDKRQERAALRESEAGKLAIEYRRLSYRTLAWALKKLSLKGSFAELRQFCARVVAVMCFRLPSFGRLVYEAILPADETSIREWARSSALQAVLSRDKRRFEHPEWSTGWYSLHETHSQGFAGGKKKKKKKPEAAAPAASASNGAGAGAGAPQSPLAHPTAASEGTAAAGGEGEGDDGPEPSGRTSPRVRVVGNSENETLLDWRLFHRNLEKVFGKAALEEQEALLPMGSTKGGVFQPPMWLRRVQKHGHFFFLMAREWITYVLNVLGTLATNATEKFEGRSLQSGIRWHRLPGYKQILRAFLLELRRRDTKDLPESLRALAMMLLVDPHLITPFVNVIIPKTNVYDLDNVTATIDLISAWFTAVHGWPGRFVAAKLFREHGPMTAERADAELSKARSVYFVEMEETKKREDRDDRTRLAAARLPLEARAEDAFIQVAPPPAPLASMRAAGSLANTTAQHTVPKYTSVVDPGPASSAREYFVSAWDFDSVSIYFPYLDVVRRNYRKANPSSGAVELLGISRNNDRSKCNWFAHLYADVPPILPSSFGFALFTHMLWILLHSEHFQVVLKTLELVYNHWSKFPQSFQERIRAMMLYQGSTSSFIAHNDRHEKGPDPRAAAETLPTPRSSRAAEELSRAAAAHAFDEHVKVNLFVTLFFHWQDDVQYFFQSLIAFHLCRGPRCPNYDKLLAAVRIALVSIEPAVWDTLWGSDNDKGDSLAEARRNQRRSVLGRYRDLPPSVEDVQGQFLVGRALLKTLSDEERLREEQRLATQRRTALDLSWLTDPLKMLGSPTKSPEARSPQHSDASSSIGSARSLRDVDSIVRQLSLASDDVQHSKTGPAKTHAAAACNYDRTQQEIVARMKADLAKLSHKFWPIALRPYAVPAVAKFRRIWQNSLEVDAQAPHLEWSVVVMDRGEMRSVGGLAHFEPPPPRNASQQPSRGSSTSS